MRQRVSLCLIAKNEEANLPTCLASVRDLVQEIVVVDTGSTHRTKEVAEAHRARVFDFAWVDDFAAARNESLRQASGDWILWLDGDEHFDEPNREKLRALFAGLKPENAAHVMKQRSAPEQAGNSATVVDQVRLFRNRPEVRWRYRVHEQILPALREAHHEVRFTDICLEHTGYQDATLLGRKTERNLRLLHLQEADAPDDPFTLFNLGWVYQDVGEPIKAIPYLRRSLSLSQPGDSIVRKLYTLLARAHQTLGQGREALAACRAGRARCPDDPELLFLEAQMLRERGDPAGAERCLRQLLSLRPGIHFASLDVGVRGVKARNQLAWACWEQGRAAEAEEAWQAVLEEQPHFMPAWQGLGERYLAQGRWDELEQAVAQLTADGGPSLDAMLLRARGHIARKELGPARQLLHEAIAQHPRALGPRVFLSHVLLQSQDLAAAEPALRAVLELDPRQAEAWRNLAVLLKSQHRFAEAVAVCQAGQEHCPGEPNLLLLQGIALHEQGDLQAAEVCLLRLLEAQPETAAADPSARERAVTARGHLAALYRSQNRFTEAEAQQEAVHRPRSANGELSRAAHAAQRSEREDVQPLTPLRCVRGSAIAFASFSPFPFTIDTPYQQPLGGSESALCYLAEALAQQGHEIFLLNANKMPSVCRGVHCLPFSAASIRQLGPLDALIVQNYAGRGRELRALLPRNTPLVFWSQHAHDQPAVQVLHEPGERQVYDHIVLVSDWQRRQYLSHFALDPERTIVLRNAIGPAFAALFDDTTAILAQKTKPPVLAYTSTPYRGLDWLLDAFGQIRRAVPETRLKVFSSMRVYRVTETEEQERFASLYQRCRETDGVEYVGSLPQPELARQLRAASVLAYPNTFAETSCIAALEALASGCSVVTSDLAALPETTAGFARLIPINGDREAYLRGFVAEVVQVLQQLGSADGREVEKQLRRQVDHVIDNCTWSGLAGQWGEWLNHIRTGPTQA